MGVWMGADDGIQWDDGLKFRPGEDGFTADLAREHFGEQGFNYVGTPNWEPPPEESVEAPDGEEPAPEA